MAGTQVLVDEHTTTTKGYPHWSGSAEGVREASVARPEGYEMWAIDAFLEDGAELTWPSTHGEEGVYLIEGLLEVDGRRCEARGAIIVESDAPATVKALAPSRILHVGSDVAEPPDNPVFGKPAEDGHTVHVVSPSGLFVGTVEADDGVTMGGELFADSTCDTCRINFFRVWSDGPSVTESHEHTEDELIHVISGTLQVGPTRVDAGSTIAVPANRRYGFRTKGPFEFINYRRVTPYVVHKPGSEPILETGEGYKMQPV